MDKDVMLVPGRNQYLEIEEHWRNRLTSAEERLAKAVAESKRVLADFQEGSMVPPDGSLAVRNARLEESSSRKEYMRVLRIFTDLTLYGKVPLD
jgi:hypothetical protein